MTLNRRSFGRNGLCSRPRGGRHQQCLGKVAPSAAVFREELWVAILRGIKRQLRRDHRDADGQVGVYEIMLIGEDQIKAFHERSGGGADGCALGLADGDEHALGAWPGRDQFVDDLTGLPQPPDLRRAARAKELECVDTKQTRDV